LPIPGGSVHQRPWPIGHGMQITILHMAASGYALYAVGGIQAVDAQRPSWSCADLWFVIHGHHH